MTTLKIDRAGRVVIPKPVRDRMRLDPGADIEMEETAEGLLLRKISQKPSLVEQHGILVHLGKPPQSSIGRAFLKMSVRSEQGISRACESVFRYKCADSGSRRQPPSSYTSFTCSQSGS